LNMKPDGSVVPIRGNQPVVLPTMLGSIPAHPSSVSSADQGPRPLRAGPTGQGLIFGIDPAIQIPGPLRPDSAAGHLTSVHAQHKNFEQLMPDEPLADRATQIQTERRREVTEALACSSIAGHAQPFSKR
jgi:hypothetical protein